MGVNKLSAVADRNAKLVKTHHIRTSEKDDRWLMIPGDNTIASVGALTLQLRHFDRKGTYIGLCCQIFIQEGRCNICPLRQLSQIKSTVFAGDI
ncbi:hypothetical protein AVEN_93864-1 [Araneus ventricosus]|uniref:Uncharacterized protein n=1 Tax=Araneus ventricosus TaxID=182803 RepID=A0A4Y2B053_ARAVE|nr:hypothetical protein AVEN_93864-1 [Araneus ventricosus]